MKRWYPFTQLLVSRLKGFYREPIALFWVYGFPLILAVVLGIATADRESVLPAVDIVAGSSEAEALHGHLVAVIAEQLRKSGLPEQAAQERAETLIEFHDEADCQQRLAKGKTALYIVPEPAGYQYHYDKNRSESAEARYRVDSEIQRWHAGKSALPTEDKLITELGNRYIDFFMPGLVGMNLMGGGLWGVGFVLVDMRIRKLLKRLLATPMRRSDFMLSILAGRLTLMVPDMLILIGVAVLGFHVPMRGNLLTLSVLILVGASAFAGLGLLISSRTEKIETVSGLMNLVMMPMWLLSGVFFDSKRFPAVMQPFIQALPLTQLNDALRAVMLDGASLVDVSQGILILSAWAVVTFALALKLFRWE